MKVNIHNNNLINNDIFNYNMKVNIHKNYLINDFSLE